MRLQDKVAIVTGGGGGMGRGISHCLSREGADVVVADLNLAGAQATVEVVEENGRKGRGIVADVASETACQALVALQPQLAVARNNLGIALQLVGRSAEAEDEFRRALALRPDYADARENLAVALKAVKAGP